MKLGDFSFSLFLESVRPMLRAVSELLGTPIQKFIDELVAVWSADSRLTSKTKAEQDLKKKKEEKKAAVTPAKLRELMPDDVYKNIKRSFTENWEDIEYLLRQLVRIIHGSSSRRFQDHVRPQDFVEQFSEVISIIKYDIDASSKTGRKLLDVIAEYMRECQKIMQDQFSPETSWREKAEQESKGLDDEERRQLFADAEYEHEQQRAAHDHERLERLQRALDKLEKDFIGALDGLDDKSKEERALTPVYETRGNR